MIEGALSVENVSPTDLENEEQCEEFELEELSGSTRDLLAEEPPVEDETPPVDIPTDAVPPVDDEPGPVPYVRFKQVNDELVQTREHAQKWRDTEPWNPVLDQIKREFKSPEDFALAMRGQREQSAVSEYEQFIDGQVNDGKMDEDTGQYLKDNFGKSIRAGVHAPDMEAERTRLQEQANQREAQAAETRWNSDFDNWIGTLKTDNPGLNEPLHVETIRYALLSRAPHEKVASLIEQANKQVAASQVQARAAQSAALKNGTTHRSGESVRRGVPVVDTGRGASVSLSDTGPDPLTDPKGWDEYRERVLLKR